MGKQRCNLSPRLTTIWFISRVNPLKQASETAMPLWEKWVGFVFIHHYSRAGVRPGSLDHNHNTPILWLEQTNMKTIGQVPASLFLADLMYVILCNYKLALWWWAMSKNTMNTGF